MVLLYDSYHSNDPQVSLLDQLSQIHGVRCGGTLCTPSNGSATFRQSCINRAGSAEAENRMKEAILVRAMISRLRA